MQSPNRVNNIPLLGQQQQQAKTQMQAIIGQLAMQLYVEAIGKYIRTPGSNPVDVYELRRVAKDCLLAAQCYFEGIGMIEIEDGEAGE